MIIDCDGCVMRDIACGDCVVSVLLGPPGASGDGFDAQERAALGVLADSGLVPPLRLLAGGSHGSGDPAGERDRRVG